MAEQNQSSEKKEQPGESRKRGRRRYYRKRSGSKEPQAESAPTKPDSQPSPPPAASKEGRDRSQSQDGGRRRNRRGRSRRRRGGAQGGAESSASQPSVLENENNEYVEPADVFIYTHVIRPGYRDFNEYVPERFPVQAEENESPFREILPGEIPPPEIPIFTFIPVPSSDSEMDEDELSETELE